LLDVLEAGGEIPAMEKVVMEMIGDLDFEAGVFRFCITAWAILQEARSLGGGAPGVLRRSMARSPRVWRRV